MNNIIELDQATPSSIEQEQALLESEVVSIDPVKAFGDIEAEIPDAREDEDQGIADNSLDLPDQDANNTPLDDGFRHTDPFRGETVTIPALKDCSGNEYVWAFYEPKFKSNGEWMSRRGNGGKKLRAEYLEWVEKQHREAGKPDLVLPDENGEILTESERNERLNDMEYRGRYNNAVAMTMGGFGLMQMFVDEDEWKPEQVEIDLISKDLAAVLEEQSWNGWGPKGNLAMNLLAVVVKRKNKKKTSSFLGGLWGSAKRKMYGSWCYLTGKSAGKRQEQADQASQQGN